MVLIENRKHAMFFVIIFGHFLDTNSFHACHILIFPLIVQFFISMVFQKVGILKVNKLSTYRICKNDKEFYCLFRRINLWCNSRKIVYLNLYSLVYHQIPNRCIVDKMFYDIQLWRMFVVVSPHSLHKPCVIGTKLFYYYYLDYMV